MSRYFDRDPSEWNIESFLENCDQKTTRAKLGLYTTCLSKIVKDENRPRREKAQILLDSIKKVCLLNFFFNNIRNWWRGDDL